MRRRKRKDVTALSKKNETVICAVCGKKNKFPVLTGGFENRGILHSSLCPEAEEMVENEIDSVVQRCSKCGYVFPCIAEDMDVSRRLLRNHRYSQPFGAVYEVVCKAVEAELQEDPENVLKRDRKNMLEKAANCFRIALVYRHNDCSFQAAKWFIQAAVLLYEVQPQMDFVQVIEAAQTVCYANAEAELSQYMTTRKWKLVNEERELEACLAHLNMMRLQKMFDRVERWGNEKQYMYRGTGRDLIEAMIRLAQKKDSSYMSYSEMLRMQ